MIDIERYAEGVIGSAEEEAGKIRKQADRQRAAELTRAEDSLLEKYFHDMQAKVLRLRSESRRRLSEVYRNGMREVFDHRNAIVESVFGETFSKIAEYRKTEAYRDLLKRQADYFKNTENIKTVYSSAEDMDTVKKFAGEMEVSADGTIALGGLKGELMNGIVLDLTMDSRVEEAREEFVRTSGLKLQD